MCTPLAIGLALTAAGTAASASGQHKAYNAETDARNAEQLRQNNYRTQSEKYFNENLGQQGVNAANASLDANSAANAAALNAVNSTSDVKTPTAESITGQEGPKVINTEIGNRLSQATRFNNQQGTAKGRLDSYGDWTLGNQLNNLKTSNQIGLQGNFMQGSAGVLPWEMEDASHRGDSLKGLGTVLSSLGSVAGLGASMGVGGAAQAAAGSGAANSAAMGATAGSGFGGVPLSAIGDGVPISGYLLNPQARFQRQAWGVN